MFIKNLIDEDFINYKKAAMFVAFPYCSFKCEKDCGVHCCQNSELAKACNIDVSPHVLTARYMDNPVTSSIVFGGLEPFGIVVIAVTVAVDIAEVVAIIVIRRAKPPVARHDKCFSAYNLCIKIAL